jgi:carbohydrate-binding DOMON domain-containing protein
MKKTFIFFLLIFFLAIPSHADKLLFKLTDPIGDDYGPGAYVYPTNPVFKPGSFDLAGFEVYDGDNDIIFKVYFKNWFTIPPDLQISNDKNLKDLFRTSLYLQNVDIYIDKDHKYNSGIINTIPGRNVKIASESAWEQAIFISPLPFLARVETKRLAKEIVDKIVIPANYEVSKNCVQLRISKKIVGQPSERWGYLIVVTGAEWEASMFSLSNWMNYGSSYEEPDLSRIVEKSASEWEFGGGDLSGTAPNVIDMVVASGESQEKILAAYDPSTKKRSVLTAVYPFGGTPEAGTAGSAEAVPNEIKVIDVVANVVTIDAGKKAGIYVGRLGQIYDGSDTLVATILVEETRDNVAICTVVPMTQRGEINAGMKVRFK